MSGMTGQSPESEAGISKNELCGLRKLTFQWQMLSGQVSVKTVLT